MAAPATGMDFDKNRLSTGEMIAGVSGFVLLIDLWFNWYGVKVSGAGGVLKNFEIGVSATAWQAFGFIDIVLFVVALIAIGGAVLRAMDRMPDLPWPAGTIVTGAGVVALILIVYRIIDTPVDTGGVSGIDVTRKFGVWLGLLAAAGVTYGGWRSMQEGPVLGSSAGEGGVSPTAPPPAAPPAAAPSEPPVEQAPPAEPPAEGGTRSPAG